ncbi:MAG TPA: D-Ala-D-Ala carboxypeptidase family metallohydrolase [Gemmatimonadaceae bacterium]|nr:D-Ala-D-Ala carboxypeptidase family metallohydrolase [Gemmatimonadaceae bacterium]
MKRRTSIATRSWHLHAIVCTALLLGSVSAPLGAQEARELADSGVAESGSWRSLVGPGDMHDDALLLGRSGRLRFVLAGTGGTAPDLSSVQRLFGDSAATRPGVYTARDGDSDQAFSVMTLLPFDAKSGATVNGYRVGYWPAERRTSGTHETPPGFIVVRQEDQDTRVSEHFTLRDFLTHDQRDVWPKLLVLRTELVDKLELVMEELNRTGVRATRMVVLSGFRTPQYNQRGVGRGGRASDSRHQYGDAADVFVDNDGNGRLDDLNGDKRVDSRDVRVMLKAVERVEKAWPELVGGAGLYKATSAHGPFVHIDVRGTRTRWGGA